MGKEISVRQARYPSPYYNSFDPFQRRCRTPAGHRSPKRDEVATAHTCPARTGYQAIIGSKMSFTKLYRKLPDAFAHLMGWPSFPGFSLSNEQRREQTKGRRSQNNRRLRRYSSANATGNSGSPKSLTQRWRSP